MLAQAKTTFSVAGGIELLQVDADDVDRVCFAQCIGTGVVIFADLDFERERVTTLEVIIDIVLANEEAGAVELGGQGDPVDFVFQGAEFTVEEATLSGSDRITRRLHSQFTKAGQHVGGLHQATFCGLNEGDTIVGVAACLGKGPNIGTQVVRDCQTGGIVGGTIDSLTGSQL